jgi:copper chaperone CopZ
MSTTVTYSVQGMTCGGCAKRVRTAIEADVPGLSEIQIDPKAGRVQITADQPISDDAIRAAVEKTSYRYAGPLT